MFNYKLNMWQNNKIRSSAIDSTMDVLVFFKCYPQDLLLSSNSVHDAVTEQWGLESEGLDQYILSF